MGEIRAEFAAEFVAQDGVSGKQEVEASLDLLIGDLAEKGCAIVLVSSDLPELLGLCDRIGVLRAGRMVGEVERADFSQDRIMSLAAVG